jgi:IS5 family transposase
LAVTSARADGGQFVLGVRTLPGDPYDGHTLGAQIEQVERLTGHPVKRAYVDRGAIGPQAGRPHPGLCGADARITSPTIRRELRRRIAIEPVIGHLKSDCTARGFLDTSQCSL